MNLAWPPRDRRLGQTIRKVRYGLPIAEREGVGCSEGERVGLGARVDSSEGEGVGLGNSARKD